MTFAVQVRVTQHLCLYGSVSFFSLFVSVIPSFSHNSIMWIVGFTVPEMALSKFVNPLLLSFSQTQPVFLAQKPTHSNIYQSIIGDHLTIKKTNKPLNPQREHILGETQRRRHFLV